MSKSTGSDVIVVPVDGGLCSFVVSVYRRNEWIADIYPRPNVHYSTAKEAKDAGNGFRRKMQNVFQEMRKARP